MFRVWVGRPIPMATQAPKIWRYTVEDEFEDVLAFANRHNLKPGELIVCYNYDLEHFEVGYFHHEELK